MNLDGNSALVAASSSGLGKAAAIALAREGANVVINGRNESRLEEAVSEVEVVAEGRVVGQPGDLTVDEDIERLVDRTVEEFGTVDHLVTNSGGPPSRPFLETTDQDWYDAFDLLVMSVVRLLRESAEHLRVGDGSIVMIASTSVKEVIDSLVLSNAVRMSVIGLEKTLSRELSPEVRVNAVLPGGHETARTEDLIQQGMERGDFESYEDGMNHWTEGVPLHRIGEPLELGDAIAFLSSERASFINGVALPVDGGAMRASL